MGSPPKIETRISLEDTEFYEGLEEFIAINFSKRDRIKEKRGYYLRHVDWGIAKFSLSYRICIIYDFLMDYDEEEAFARKGNLVPFCEVSSGKVMYLAKEF